MNGAARPVRSALLAPAGAEAAALAEVTLGADRRRGADLRRADAGAARAGACARGRRGAGRSRGWIVGGGIVFPLAVLSALLVYGTWRTHALDRRDAPPTRSVDQRHRRACGGGRCATATRPAAREIGLGQRAAPAGRPAGAARPDQRRRDPQLLGAGARRQGRHGAGPRAPACARSATRPASPRPVRRVLRRAACAHGAARRRAMPPDEFDRWLAAQAAPAARRHRRRCCSAAAPPSSQRAAPPATACAASADDGRRRPRPHARRQPAALGAGTLRNDGAGALAAWITDVQALKPGARMPSLPPARRRHAATRWPACSGAAAMTRDTRCRACRAAAAPAGELERARARPGAAPRGWRLLERGQQHHIGLLYIATALLFFVLAGVLGAADARAARAARATRCSARDLQPGLHDARHRDDVPVRGAGGRGDRGLPAAGHARRARPAVPAPVGLRLLGLRDRRPGLLLHALLRRRRPTAAGSCTRR